MMVSDTINNQMCALKKQFIQKGCRKLDGIIKMFTACFKDLSLRYLNKTLTILEYLGKNIFKINSALYVSSIHRNKLITIMAHCSVII